MYPAKFDYHRASSVDEVVSLLKEHGEEAKLLAGGHSLIPMMKLRLAQPTMLVDLNGVEELRAITPTRDGGLRIGSMATYSQIAQANTGYDVLTEACFHIGDPQVQNRGTIGGSLAHNDPAGDLPAVMLALEAHIEIVGPDGKRRVSIEEFIVGLMETALQPNEIVTAVRIPSPHPGANRATGSAYEKLHNPASGYAICGVAAVVEMGEKGKAKRCRVAVTGAADHAQRLRNVEEALEGKALTPEAIAAACERAGEGLDFLSDIHADEAYRAQITRVLTCRALERAAAAAQGTEQRMASGDWREYIRRR